MHSQHKGHDDNFVCSSVSAIETTCCLKVMEVHDSYE